MTLIFVYFLLGLAQLGQAFSITKRNSNTSDADVVVANNAKVNESVRLNDTIARIISRPKKPNNGTAKYKPLFAAYSKDTPRFKNVTQVNVNPLFRAAHTSKGAGHAGKVNTRQLDWGPGGEGTCAPGTPCANDACCSSTGICGYSPDHCGLEVCISNCDAKANCGRYAPAGEQKCPLNVCCSQHGFCGTTAEFCGTGCDALGGSCGPAPTPANKGSTAGRNIGYYESWANTRQCDRVRPQDLDLFGLSHLNFAFAFFHPTTFEVTAMDKNAESLLQDFTALRSTKPGLETWISVGGWTFNDETNRPNTRHAFSDMASTAVNRAKFIKSIIHFMSTYGFQGVDIDWEYPGARDRGGRPEDKGNFVILCREMQAAFAGRFGLTVTLPASFWYLQHFDVKAMEPYVSWFNVMTYDIHGVWDRDNRYTGPYVRPHTNLTQIDDALGLLWRAGVNAANVVMGLGYYGRSFTLADPTCTGPGCLFKEGGAKGDCTDSMGILSAAEIDRIITSNIGKRDVHGRDVIGVIHDTVAAVKIATFGGTQWVSFDDEDTFSAKKQLGTMLGLGGYMAWAIDQGMFGKTNAATHKDVKRELDKWGYRYEDYEDYSAESTAADTCYATFCGGSCAPGYSQWTQMSGEIGDLGQGTACKNGELQTLCCRTGATQGTCEWFGWRGFGLPCSSGNDGGCPEDYTLLTHNTASYVQVRGSYQGMRRGWSHSSLTCTGGTQSYCCKGFKPSQHKNDLKLLQPGMIDGSPSSLAKRDATSCAFIGAVVGASLVVFPPASLVTGFALLLAGVEASVFCFEAQSLTAATVMSGVAGPTTRGRKNKAASGQAYSPYMRPVKSKPKAAPGVAAQYGRYTKWDLDGKTTCSTSYMCEYGNGFDQVCDNQRWALDKIPNVGNVFHYVGGAGGGRSKQRWPAAHHDGYRGTDWTLRTFPGSDGFRVRCEIDEFPLDSLKESERFAPQALRALDGNENGRQGRDWQDWLYATWWPCSTLLQAPPPITWAVPVSGLGPDARRTAGANQIIPKYGWDSTSGRPPCFATYTPPAGPKETILDHGFRVGAVDPLFAAPYHWRQQDYRADPQNLAAGQRPQNVPSIGFMRRGAVETCEKTPEPTGVPTPTRRARTGGARATAAGASGASCDGTDGQAEERRGGWEDSSRVVTTEPPELGMRTAVATEVPGE